MEFGGRYRIAASRADVWAALNDTAKLAAAIPGCRRLDWTGPETLDLEIEVNLGIMKPTLGGDLSLVVTEPARSYRLAGRGRGGLLGLAEGAADITLADDGDATLLEFIAEGGASGKIMSLGKKLIGNSAQKVIDGFFERFAVAMDADLTVLPPPAVG